jgi:[acyl-carrier-protein] S-malonyltransferase
MKFAVIFPGQGSQSVNMLLELAEQYPVVKETFDEASAVLAYDLWELITRNPDNKLNQTQYTQPAMLAAGVAVWRLWQSLGLPQPAMLAGHSLGEYTSLVAAEVLSFDDALKLVNERARLMQAAVPEGQGAMAAILGLEEEDVRALCKQVAQGEIVEAVNFNTQEQIVIAGHSAAVARAVEQATAFGAKRAVPLAVSVPSHSSLMKNAAVQLAQYMSGIKFASPKIPVLHNVDAEARAQSAAIIDALQMQLWNPVLWVDTVSAMVDAGIEAVIEMGPGKVLVGLCRRIDKNLHVAAIDTSAGLQKAIETIRGEKS